MYRLAIVEDDAEQAEALEWRIRCSPRSSECAVICFANAEELGAFVRDEGDVDILLIDIKLGEGEPDGIEAVQSLVPAGSRTQVIYVTGHVEYCTRVYRTEHIYFLTKPVRQDDLDDALDKAFENLARQERPLAVRVDGSIVFVPPSSIDYLESDRRKVRIHAGARTLEAYGPMSKIADELPAGFLQCHKSFLVNIDRIVELRANDVLLASGAALPVSQKRRKAVREALVGRVVGRL